MNNICKLLPRLSQQVKLIAKVATRQSIGMTYVPMRMVHARGYNDFYDNWSFIFHEINFALSGAKTTDQFVYVFKKYGKDMTDFQISYAFWMIGKQQLERTPDFWEYLLPIVKTQMARLDRNCTKSLYHFIEGASAMTLQDNEFWELVE